MIDRQKMYFIASNAEAGTLESLPITANMEIVDSEHLQQTNLRFAKQDKVCIASEAALEIVVSRIEDPARKNAIEVLKNKYTFRKMLNVIYPDYQYQFIKFQDIVDLKITQKSVIKPVKGVFGTAVRIIDRDTDLPNLAMELQAELSKNVDIFSESVLSKSDFIVEQYLEGEEYAVDMFYNNMGVPCIVNIYHHPMPKNQAYLHMIYYSSQEVFDDIYAKAKYFFIELNQVLDVTNIPMHGEFKFDGDRLMPIEINTLRFGGMGLGNLVFHTLKVNPYTYFLNDIEPDWQTIWQDNSVDLFAFFIAYNGINSNANNTQPNRERLKQKFTKILLERTFDHQNQLAFGIYCLKETKQNISTLLEIEFDDFFELI
jgi:ATP-grasp domain